VSDRDRILTSPASSHPFSPFEETDSLGAPEEPAQGFREGLPLTYRMRADAHYVEQLDAPSAAVTIQYVAVQAIDVSDASSAEPDPSLVDSIRRVGVLEPLVIQRNNGRYTTITGQNRLAAARAAGLRDVPCLVHHIGDDKARILRDALIPRTSAPEAQSHRLLRECDAEIAHSLSALGSCAGLLGAATPRLTRTVAADLIHAEVWRATCLLQAATVLKEPVALMRSQVFPREVVQRVLSSVAVQRRLRPIPIDVEVTVQDARALLADEELLVRGVASLLLATMTLLDGVSGARVAVTATADRGRFILSVSQSLVIADELAAEHACVPSAFASDEFAVALSVAALRRIVKAHDGRLSVARVGAGARVSLDLPLEVPAA
jgi:hypothetical protein